MKGRICRFLLCVMILAFVAGELFGAYVAKLLFDKNNSLARAEELTLQLNLTQSAIMSGDFEAYEKAKANSREVFDVFKKNGYTKENFQEAVRLTEAYYAKLDERQGELKEIMAIHHALTDLKRSAFADSDMNNTAGYYEAFAQELENTTWKKYKTAAEKYARYARRLAGNANEIAVCYGVCPKNLIEEKYEKYQQALLRIDSIKEEMQVEDFDVSKITDALKIAK